MLGRKNLHDYQNYAVSFIKERRKCLLFLDMGLGKSVITLTSISDMMDDFLIDKILILAPLRVCNTVWKQEIDSWSHLNMKAVICTGSAKERTDALNSQADIYIINFENVAWMVDNFPWTYDALVIDESSAFRSHRSKRFKKIKKNMHKTKVSIMLTGTPTPSGYINLWAQVYLVDFGKRLGKTITNFRNRFFKSAGYMGYSYELTEGSQEKIENAISDISISMSAEDHLDLPDVIYINEYVNFDAKTKSIYRELQDEFIVSLAGTDIECPSPGVLSNKLLQICNGAVYDEEKNYHVLHDEKIKYMKEIIEDNPSENFLVAYNFKSDLERLKKAFPEGVVLDSSNATVEKWNSGKIKILFAHPASAGHGLNLQKGGSVIIWFGLNWSLELYQQFNARLNRQGQTKKVRVIHIVAKGSLDELVMLALSQKAKTQQQLLDYLKANISQ